MFWKMLLVVTLATEGAALAQSSAAGSRFPLTVAINGQLVNAVIVMAASGSPQAWACPAPQPYVTADGKQGWACFDPVSGVWFLGALPPAVAPRAMPVPPSSTAAAAASEQVSTEGSASEPPPQVVYVEAPPRVIYVEKPPEVIYVPVPSPPEVVYVPSPPEVVYVQGPPTVVVVDRPSRGGRDGRNDRRDDWQDRVDPPPTTASSAPVYTSAPVYVNRPVYANPPVAAAVSTVDRGGRGNDRGSSAPDRGRGDGPARGR
jgi:hypothetical protein